VAAQFFKYQHRGRAADAARFKRNQRLIGARITLGEQARVPGDFGGLMAQKIRSGEASPGERDRLGRDVLIAQQEPGRILRFAHQLLLIQGTFQPAPQRALYALVELVEE
jgi:hypothetical protein